MYPWPCPLALDIHAYKVQILLMGNMCSKFEKIRCKLLVYYVFTWSVSWLPIVILTLVPWLMVWVSYHAQPHLCQACSMCTQRIGLYHCVHKVISVFVYCYIDVTGAAMAKWLNSWHAEKADRGSNPGLATLNFRDWLSPASKSRYDWNTAETT